MQTNNSKTGIVVRPLVLALAAAIAGGVSTSASALEFGSTDGWSGTLNTTLSYGVSFRVADQNPDLIAKAHYDPFVSLLPNAQERAAKGTFSANHDDGDLNYSQGSAFSNAVKVTSELSLKHGENFGAFVRASYFYDFANANKDELPSATRDQVGKRFRILDAFVFGNFALNNQQGTIRFGKQVLSWGESTFIQGGINVINPIDVSQLHVAGAELKDALLPVNMLWGSYSLSDKLSVEATYLLEFSQTNPDPEGSFFSTTDIASIGANYASLPFGLVPQPVNNADNYYSVCFGGAPSDNPAFGGASILAARTNPLAGLLAASCEQTVRRAPDRYPSEYGQYGVAVHYLSDILNGAEFAFYYLNYSSRLPLLSGTAVTTTDPTSATYFVEYPRHIRMFGVSFNTQFEGPNIALQGELSYRPNQPLQIDDVELLYAGLSPLNELIPQPAERFYSQLGVFAPGAIIPGYTRNHVAQLQFTATKVFGPNNVFKADQIAMIAEVGATDVTNLPARDTLRFQGDGTETGGGADALLGILTNPETQVKGFPSAFSWGYRIAARADYNNAFGTAFTLSPRVAFYHDVNGISPGPGGAFIEGRKQITVGAEANYLNRWSLDLSYTNYFGAGDLNLINDRDFVAFVVKYSF
jgi:Protein of unknown function (DUF1302)